MPGNNPFNVTVELPDGIESIDHFTDANGVLLPERQVLHELIAQAVTVSENV